MTGPDGPPRPPRAQAVPARPDSRRPGDGESLYVLDFGVNKVLPSTVVAYGHTGVLWKLTRKGVQS